jgi:L-ascorbate metabolism protein UlaG (beta-lactamase superfamily)
MKILRFAAPALSVAALGTALLLAQEAGPQPVISRQSDGDMLVQIAVPAGQFQRVETTTDLQAWQPLATVASNGTAQYRDGAAVYHGRKSYRFVPVAGTSVFTGDHLATSAGDAIIQPKGHATFIIQWNGKTIYCDPVTANGSSTISYTGLPKADIILISHSHGDHWNSTTVNNQRNTTACTIYAPQAVYTAMNTTLRGLTTVMANNATATHPSGLGIEAIPAYNSNHALGTGNGYVLTLGGKRLYFSGDTGDIPETRALQNIDAAFLCMNIPFTMNVTSAISVVRAFKPKVIYPYHYRNQDSTYADLALFESQVGTDLGIEVRLRTWY